MFNLKKNLFLEGKMQSLCSVKYLRTLVFLGPEMLNRHGRGKRVIFFLIKIVKRQTDHLLIRDRPLIDM